MMPVRELRANVTRASTHPTPAIRELRAEDIPQVAALHGRVFGTGSSRTLQQLTAYFEEIFFRNPWRDASLPSLVAAQNGQITGFLGVVPRPMRLHGRTIRVAVCTQFMVDPHHRSGLGAVQLLKSFFAGPQDLSLADGANESARRMWLALGGTAPLLYSLHWVRPLRPARYVLALLERRAPKLRSLVAMGRPVAALADAAAAHMPLSRIHEKQGDSIVDEPLQPSTMFAYLPDVMTGTDLQPQYNAEALEWLLDQAARMTRHGTLRARAVRDREHRLLGWFMHYAHAGGIGEVVQIAARNGSFDRIFQRLLLDAWRHGATAVRGRLDPRFAQELTDRHCWFRRDCNWTLVHTRDPDLLSVIHQGKVFLSRLEGEWWMRFSDPDEPRAGS